MNLIPTISVTIREYADKDKLQTVRLRVTFERKSLFKSLGIKVLAANFKPGAEGFKYVSSSDKQSIQKNAMIKREYELLEDQFYKQAASGPLTIEHVKAILANQSTHSARFTEVANTYLKNGISNEGSRRRWAFCLQLVDTFAPGLYLTKINKQWLLSFEDFLHLKYKNPNSRLAPMKFVRAVINYGIERGIEMDYPYGSGKYKLPTEEKRMRNYLTVQQLDQIKIWLQTTTDTNCLEAGKWFLLQCYSGMRYSDISTWHADRVRDSRIYFSDVKTGTPHFIPLYPELTAAIQAIENMQPLPYERYKRALRTIGIAIGLPFALTSHMGRHTFAVHYLEGLGNVYVLKQLLGHSDIKTTMIYAKVTDEAIENDMKRVRG